MTYLRVITVVTITFVLSACAGSAPKGSALEQNTRNSIHISSVAVDVSEIGEHTDGRPVSASTVASILQETADDILVGAGGGPRAAEVRIQLQSVNILSGGQAVLLGGESVMSGHVTLLDAHTNEILIPPTKIDAGGGGWVLGGIIAAASLDDPRTELRQMSHEYADRIMIVVFGN